VSLCEHSGALIKPQQAEHTLRGILLFSSKNFFFFFWSNYDLALRFHRQDSCILLTALECQLRERERESAGMKEQGKPGGLREQGECVWSEGESNINPYRVFEFVAVES